MAQYSRTKWVLRAEKQFPRQLVIIDDALVANFPTTYLHGLWGRGLLLKSSGPLALLDSAQHLSLSA